MINVKKGNFIISNNFCVRFQQEAASKKFFRHCFFSRLFFNNNNKCVHIYMKFCAREMQVKF